eukprot:jgi/Astpho2/3205/fgenesh1_pg.00052_%23_24_t
MLASMLLVTHSLSLLLQVATLSRGATPNKDTLHSRGMAGLLKGTSSSSMDRATQVKAHLSTNSRPATTSSLVALAEEVTPGCAWAAWPRCAAAALWMRSAACSDDPTGTTATDL